MTMNPRIYIVPSIGGHAAKAFDQQGFLPIALPQAPCGVMYNAVPANLRVCASADVVRKGATEAAKSMPRLEDLLNEWREKRLSPTHASHMVDSSGGIDAVSLGSLPVTAPSVLFDGIIDARMVEADPSGVTERMVKYTRALGSPSALHVIAFSGGVDSSLVTFLLSQAYPHFTQSLESSRVPTVARAPVKSTSSSESASVVACIGISPSLPEAQLQMARQVAAHIGVPLWEVPTMEGTLPEYVANQGDSCFFCKSTLYTTLHAVAEGASRRHPNREQRQSTTLCSEGTLQPITGRETGSAELSDRATDESWGGETGGLRDDLGSMRGGAENGGWAERAGGVREGEGLPQSDPPVEDPTDRTTRPQDQRELLTPSHATVPHAASREAQGKGEIVSDPIRRKGVREQQAGDSSHSSHQIILFNGTNADDLTDPTRLGLLASLRCQVASPLACLTKGAVRALARHVGLPNWEAAASPCLRSRLAVGVPATSESLGTVERAEMMVRLLLPTGASTNLRVRLFTGGSAVIEVDSELLPRAKALEKEIQSRLQALGLSYQGCRTFQSGSVARSVN